MPRGIQRAAFGNSDEVLNGLRIIFFQPHQSNFGLRYLRVFQFQRNNLILRLHILKWQWSDADTLIGRNEMKGSAAYIATLVCRVLWTYVGEFMWSTASIHDLHD